MADSIRKQIIDAVESALEGISIANGYNTDVKLVDESLKGYQEIGQRYLPAIFPIDAEERKEPAAIGIGAADDTEAVLTIVCTCVVYQKLDRTRQPRTDLMRDVEKALVNDTTLAALISHIEPTEITTDRGTIEFYSVWDQTFELTYTYNSTEGG